MISEYSRQLLQKFKMKLPRRNKKLVGTHLPLKSHLICLPLLQTLIELGLEVDKIKAVYKFKQDYYLRDYILENAALRAREKDPDKKATIKILMNGLFGVTIKNKLNYASRSRVVNDEATLLRNVSLITFKSLDVINSDRVIVNHNLTSIIADSPIYIGFSILDLAKKIMYDFWYKTLQQIYKDRVRLLYTDTDSFFISLETENLEYELNGPLKPYLDLSNFPKSHPLHSSERKGELGLLKIETGSEQITEFIGVKPKSYIYETETGKTNVTSKGMSEYVKKTMGLHDHRDAIEKGEITVKEVYNLQPVDSTMSLTRTRKVAICPYEDKRFYFSPYESYSYGHPKVREEMRRRGENVNVGLHPSSDDDNDEGDNDNDLPPAPVLKLSDNIVKSALNSFFVKRKRDKRVSSSEQLPSVTRTELDDVRPGPSRLSIPWQTPPSAFIDNDNSKSVDKPSASKYFKTDYGKRKKLNQFVLSEAYTSENSSTDDDDDEYHDTHPILSDDSFIDDDDLDEIY